MLEWMQEKFGRSPHQVYKTDSLVRPVSIHCEPGIQQPGHEAGHSAHLLKSIKHTLIYFYQLHCGVEYLHINIVFLTKTRFVTC